MWQSSQICMLSNCRAFQVELSNMYRTMEGKHYRSPEEAIEAVKEG